MTAEAYHIENAAGCDADAMKYLLLDEKVGTARISLVTISNFERPLQKKVRPLMRSLDGRGTEACLQARYLALT